MRHFKKLVCAFRCCLYLVVLIFITGCSTTERQAENNCEELVHAYYLIDGVQLDFSDTALLHIKLPGVEGASTIESYRLVTSVEGDINGDGVKDKVAIIANAGAGSGTFYYVAAAIRDFCHFIPVGSQFVGDRVKIDDFQVVDRSGPSGVEEIITLSFYGHRDNAGLADAPDLFMTRRFMVQQGALINAP